jgi:WD40 repeat protein
VFSPSDEHLAVVDGERLEVWDLKTRTRLYDRARKRPINFFTDSLGFRPRKLVFSADGKHFALLHGDSDIDVYNTASGSVIRLIGHDGKVSQARFSHDNRWLVSLDGPRLTSAIPEKPAISLRVWEIANAQGDPLAVAAGSDGQCISSDGRFSLDMRSVEGQQELCAVSIPSRQVLGKLDCKKLQQVTAYAASDLQHVAVGRADGSWEVWDIQQQVSLTKGRFGNRPIIGIAIAPDGTRVAVMQQVPETKSTEPDDASGALHWPLIPEVATFQKGPPDLMPATLMQRVDLPSDLRDRDSIYGDTIPGGSKGTEIRHEPPDILPSDSIEWGGPPPKSHYRWAVLQLDNSKKVAGGDISAGERVQLTFPSDGYVAFFVRDPATTTDGESVTMVINASMELVRISDSKSIWKFEQDLLSPLHTQVIPLPDGQGYIRGYVYSDASVYGNVDVIDGRTKQVQLSIPAHARWITGLAISPDQTRIATCGSEGAVKLWDFETGAEILTLQPPEATPMTWLQFSASGDRLVGATSDGRYVAWPAPNGQ